MESDDYNVAQNYQLAMNNFMLQAGLALAITKKTRKRKNRQIGVHDINKKRDEKGLLNCWS
jgi:hypothetical protein